MGVGEAGRHSGHQNGGGKAREEKTETGEASGRVAVSKPSSGRKEGDCLPTPLAPSPRGQAVSQREQRGVTATSQTGSRERTVLRLVFGNMATTVVLRQPGVTDGSERGGAGRTQASTSGRPGHQPASTTRTLMTVRGDDEGEGGAGMGVEGVSVRGGMDKGVGCAHFISRNSVGGALKYTGAYAHLPPGGAAPSGAVSSQPRRWGGRLADGRPPPRNLVWRGTVQHPPLPTPQEHPVARDPWQGAHPTPTRPTRGAPLLVRTRGPCWQVARRIQLAARALALPPPNCPSAPHVPARTLPSCWREQRWRTRTTHSGGSATGWALTPRS